MLFKKDIRIKGVRQAKISKEAFTYHFMKWRDTDGIFACWLPSCLRRVFAGTSFFFFFKRPEKPIHTFSPPGILSRVFMRAGQAGCLVSLIFARSCFENTSLSIWGVLTVSAMAVYFSLWIRYAKHGRKEEYLYAPLGFFPVPFAIVPSLTLIFAALWGKCFLLGIWAVLFGIGKGFTHWHYYEQMDQK